VVTARDIQKFCVATGNANPRYLDPDDPVAPPGFHSIVTSHVEPLEKLQPDGLPSESLLPPLPLKRVMAGGFETDFHGPIRAGDTLTAVTGIHSIKERHGKTGALIFTVFETTITNQRGETVVVERMTLIAR
jgi:hydroxyacyl-ACP dehydratase HTD2-like protein with hotdog domain